MPVAGIDHIAMPTSNAERLITFYKKLGFLVNNEEKWRSGEVPTFSIQVGDSKLNVHPEGHTASLRGANGYAGLHRHLLRLGWQCCRVPANAE